MKDISYIDKIVKQHRTNLHKIAELSHVEFKTAKYIRDYLDKLNIEYETPLETATVGIIKGKNPKKTIAFRADIDALPTEDGAQRSRELRRQEPLVQRQGRHGYGGRLH